MALTITVGSNSWVTLSEANNYMEGKFDAYADWTSLSNFDKKACIITAYRWIYGNPNLNIPAGSTNIKVKWAQIELAWYIYRYWEEHEKRTGLYAQGVRDFTISKWKEKLEAAGLPWIVKNMLDDFWTGEYFPVIQRELEQGN